MSPIKKANGTVRGPLSEKLPSLRWGLGALLLAASLAVAAGCSDDSGGRPGASGGSGGSGNPNSAGSSAGGSGPNQGGDCASACVAHEKACGAPSPEGFCQTTCAKYQPLGWEIDCAKKVACGDNDGLLACMPDLDCKAKCVEHEKNCGDPAPDADCEQLCNQYRPTPSQVKCAQATECGDRAGLDACLAQRP